MKYKPAIKRWILDLVCSPTVAVISCAHTSEYILVLSMPTQLIRYPFLLLLPMEQTTSIEWCTAKILRRAHSAPSHRVINRAEKERERERQRYGGLWRITASTVYHFTSLSHSPSNSFFFLLFSYLHALTLRIFPDCTTLTATDMQKRRRLPLPWPSESNLRLSFLWHRCHHSSSFIILLLNTHRFFCRLAKVCKLT